MKIAVIGGGCFWKPWEIKYKEVKQATPYGSMSDVICEGEIAGHTLITLQRHGKTYEFPINEIPWRANTFGLGMQKPDFIIHLTACGSLRKEDRPGDLILFDQVIDFTKNRPSSLGAPAIKGATYLDFANPISIELTNIAHEALKKNNIHHSVGGVMLTEEGPKFSSIAESKMYKTVGADFVNQTSCPELYFFRELGLPVLGLAMITNLIDIENGGNITTDAISDSIVKFKNVTPNALKCIIENLSVDAKIMSIPVKSYDIDEFDFRK